MRGDSGRSRSLVKQQGSSRAAVTSSREPFREFGTRSAQRGGKLRHRLRGVGPADRPTSPPPAGRRLTGGGARSAHGLAAMPRANPATTRLAPPTFRRATPLRVALARPTLGTAHGAARVFDPPGPKRGRPDDETLGTDRRQKLTCLGIQLLALIIEHFGQLPHLTRN